jgi:hypothetical protein
MRLLRNQKGFSLVEAIVAGAVAVVLAGIIVTFLNMHNRALREGTASAMIQMQSDIVSSEIGRKVRSANLVLGPGEAWSSSPSMGVKDVSEIFLYDTSGVIFSAFKINGTSLQESSDGVNYNNFLAGTNPVNLAAGSRFTLSNERTEVTLFLKVAVNYKGTDYTMPEKGDMYQCRN